MANSISNVIPTIYEALDVVSRELIGAVGAVNRDTSVEQAALNQTVRSPVVPTMSAADITPAATASAGTDRTIGYVDMTIQKSRKVSFNLTGEQELSLGKNNAPILRDSFAQAIRALGNEIETDLAALYVSASRAYGTAGTAPFATAADLSDFAQTLKILDDNGAPRTGRQMVLGTAAMANLRGKQSVLFKANEAGTDTLLREGIVGRVQGFDIRDSAQVKTTTAGTGASYLVNNGAGYAIGDTAITLDTGSGTILAGDVVTFAGDTNKYVVATALAANVVTLAAPGLRKALADNTALTVGAAYTANLAFTKNAFALATRTPAVPTSGDNADDRTVVVDPVSGLAFEVALYRQYRMASWEVGIAWGVKAVKPEHACILLG